MRIRNYIWMLLAVAYCRDSCQSAGRRERQTTQPPCRPGDGQPMPRSKTATADPNYVIGAQDVLDISVWKEPEVSRVVPVRPGRERFRCRC